jgi:hypothetical protein
MKNQITLSLITVAILGLNGCGGSSNSTKSSEDVSSIQKLLKASEKHTKAEWIAIENAIQALDNTEGFNTMVLDSIEKNVASLSTVGVDKEMAYAMNSDAMYDDLTELDITDLDNQVAVECVDDDKCKEEAYSSIKLSLDIDKEMAYDMSVVYRGDDNELVNDKLVKKFTCEAGEVRTIQRYGFEDNFSTANGDENATASQQVQINPSVMAYNNNIGLFNYDTTQVNRQFGEEIKNLPSNITKGMFYIGLENHGSNDRMTLGNMDTDTSTLDYFGEDVLNLNWSQSGNVHYTELSSIMMEDGNSLKSYANANQKFDVYIQDDTYVDFITVATCSTPNPIKEVTTIVNKFECSEKETLVKIFGGEIDAFALATDANPIDPSSDLKTRRDVNTVYPNVDVSYDYTAYDHHFIDTLKLNLSSSQTVTQAEFNIGYKVIGSTLHSNDALYVGDFGTTHASGHFYDNTAPIIPQGWNVHDLTQNYGYVAKVNLFDLNNTLGTGKVANTMIAQNELDVYVQDDTAVDFTQLNLCVKDNCDEGAEEFELDLSQLASWTFKPSDAVENNVFNGTQHQGVWDDTLNWFDFENSHSDEVLEIPFCACSNTIVNINNLKADNSATVKLDGTLVASQTANDQDAMKRDDLGGTHEDGSLTLASGTNGGTNHVLRVDVHNLGSEFGVAMDGTLKFRGNLGKCQ